MGYPVYYSGEIEITPPLTEEHAAIVRAFAKGEHTERTESVFAAIAASPDPDLPFFSGLFEVSEDGARLFPEEDESRHGLGRWLALLIAHFLAPAGYILNGEIRWDSDEREDSGQYFIRENALEIVEDLHFNPGASWAPESFADRALTVAIQELLDSTANEGCSPDLTVVSAEAVEKLRSVLPKLNEFATQILG